jgi:hypothetical protein
LLTTHDMVHSKCKCTRSQKNYDVNDLPKAVQK